MNYTEKMFFSSSSLFHSSESDCTSLMIALIRGLGTIDLVLDKDKK